MFLQTTVTNNNPTLNSGMLSLLTGKEASARVYVRHRPERTLLYQLVEAYYPSFLSRLAAEGTALPGYVEREFEDYLKCGRLEHGFLRVCCDSRGEGYTASDWP